MKRIHITRDPSGKVAFEQVSIDATENVFFTNLDPAAAHWPDIATNRLGKAPSPNSSQCTVPPPPDDESSYVFTYKCKITGHENEQGAIEVYVALAAVDNTTLEDAIVNKPIATQTVVTGGKPNYTITDELFQVLDNNNNVILSGSGIGPGLQLNANTDGTGITVTGTPSVVGTYTFTFTVNDKMGRNLQQVQYSMAVKPAGA